MEAKCPKRLRRCSSSSSTYTADATFRSDLLLERGSWGLSPVVCVAQALVARDKQKAALHFEWEQNCEAGARQPQAHNLPARYIDLTKYEGEAVERFMSTACACSSPRKNISPREEDGEAQEAPDAKDRDTPEAY